MNSKEALEKIIFDYNFKEKIESGYVYHTEIPFMEAIAIIMEKLEVLEKLEVKTHLLYKDRKAIAKEFDKWCEDNNAVNCSETMATWFLSIKLKEWLNAV